jgi:hypothetical protein
VRVGTINRRCVGRFNMFAKYDIRSHIFIFLLNIGIFTATGVVLHKTEGTDVILLCYGLWETMTLILVLKCLRVTLCSIALKLARGNSEGLRFVPFDLVSYSGFFIAECITTSRALNSAECVHAASVPFDGHPIIAYVNGAACVWDGCFILTHALYALVKR